MQMKKKRIYLSLGEIEASRDFDPSRPAQVLVEVKLLLELEQLGVGVGRSQSPRQSVLCKPQQ